jgi:hypothetical protein
MAQILTTVVEEYQLAERLGFFTLDNADSNDTCLRILLRTLNPDASNGELEQRRLRCYGHIINLVAKSFLFGDSADAFEFEQDVNRSLGRELQELENWRRKGPVGKLHNVVIFIRRSPQRRELFIRVCNLEEEGAAGFLLNEEMKDLQVIQDNATRWNSTYLMIERALAKRDEIDSFISRCEREKEASKRVSPEDHLSAEDWRILGEIAAILRPLYKATIRHQGRAEKASHGSIWEVLPSMEWILSHLESLKTEYADPPTFPYEDEDVSSQPRRLSEASQPQRPIRIRRPPRHLESEVLDFLSPRSLSQPSQPSQPQPRPRERPTQDLNENSRKYIRTAINNAWEKLNEYYRLLDLSPVYVAAMVLNPGQNWRYVEERWSTEHPGWIEEAKLAVQSFWESYWKPIYDDSDDLIAEEPAQPQPSISRDPDDFEAFLRPVNYYASSRPTVDEYEAYTRLLPTPVDDIIGWWKDHESTYPHLAKMAFDLLSIPAMSAECERVFSQAKFTATPQRNRINDETLEAIQCLKNWWSTHAFDWLLDLI